MKRENIRAINSPVHIQQADFCGFARETGTTRRTRVRNHQFVLSQLAQHPPDNYRIRVHAHSYLL